MSSSNYPALKTEMANVAYNGFTDTQLVSAINAKTVSQAAPAVLKVVDIINAIHPTVFMTLTTQQAEQMKLLLGSGDIVNASPGTTIRTVFATMFASNSATMTALSGLVSPFDAATVPWYTTIGFNIPISAGDLVIARNS